MLLGLMGQIAQPILSSWLEPSKDVHWRKGSKEAVGNQGCQGGQEAPPVQTWHSLPQGDQEVPEDRAAGFQD